MFFISFKTITMSHTNYVTEDTLIKMRAELHKMKTVDRPAASAAIAEAREKGDLKENAEYDSAKEAQGHLEDRIKQMEAAIATCRIVSAEQIDTSKVSILTKVTITNLGLNKTFTYKIVSESEANIKEQKISVSSPIGKGLLGKVIGDVAEIQTPGGLLKFKVEAIEI
jgi:transcription elongation factor GreA